VPVKQAVTGITVRANVLKATPKKNNVERIYALGFRTGKFSVHTSRTMMLAELKTLLAVSPPEATRDDYFRGIIEDNLLGKTTLKARNLTAQHLAELYSLDANVCLFRVLRCLWVMEEQARPVLALLCALARDTLLRASLDRILQAQAGEHLSTVDMVAWLGSQLPERFSRATITSTAQNINSTWTQSGYLSGKRNKKRTLPLITPAAVTFALLLAYVEGARAQRLFDSFWVNALDTPKDKIHDLAVAAFQHGWLDYRRAGDVIDIRFPNLLSIHEQELLSEQT